MSHTPGPWQIVGSEIHDRRCSFDEFGARTGSTPNSICEVHIVPHAATDANARLIAAAPDLLAELEIIHANAAESPEWIRRHAAAAIAKAKGESDG